MSTYAGSRVAWTQGLFLRPQHFQQLEHYLEWVMQQRLQQLWPLGFGFSELEIDDGLRVQGKLAVRRAAGILPDGTPFSIPSWACPIEPLEVPIGTAGAVVHLHAQLMRPQVRAFAPAGSEAVTLRRVRHASDEVDLVDNTAEDGRPARIRVAKLSLGLSLEANLDGALTSLPVARVLKRTGTQSMELDDQFIPPMLNSQGHARLAGWVEELLGLVRLRGDALAARLTHQGGKAVDYLLLQLCNRYEPLLDQWHSGVPIHPVALHQELLKFAGECRTVDTKDRRAARFPPYVHLESGPCFEPVVEEIRRALVEVADETAQQLQLVDLRHGYKGAELRDPRILKQGYLVLAMSAKKPDAYVRDVLPGMVRTGAPSSIQSLIEAQTPGVRLRHLAQVPTEIRYHDGFQYFRLRRDDDDLTHWKHIEAVQRLVLFVAGDTPGLELELWWVRPAGAS